MVRLPSSVVIQLTDPYPERLVDGWSLKCAEGLVVHRSVDSARGAWSITHRATGRLVSQCESEDDAEVMVSQIGPLADWTSPDPVLVQPLAALLGIELDSLVDGGS